MDIEEISERIEEELVFESESFKGKKIIFM
jgi:hypothetical protein